MKAANIVTLTMNPAIDVSTSVERVEPTHKLRCAQAHRDPGGGGINVARVLKRFGTDVLAVYVAGGATGDLLRKLVRREGIDDLVVAEPDETREDFTVFEKVSGRQFRFVMPGPELARATWMAALDVLANLKARPAFLVASGSLPLGVPADFFANVARIAKSIGAKFVLDTAGAPLKMALAERPFLIKPNLRELRELTAMALDDEAAQLGAARNLIAEGSAEIVALTLGDQGALVTTATESWRAEAPQVEVLSTVGAGDSFLGTLVWGLASGETLEAAVRRAIAAGSAALLSPGTELCRPDDVTRLARDVVMRRL